MTDIGAAHSQLFAAADPVPNAAVVKGPLLAGLSGEAALSAVAAALPTTGFQATHFGRACQNIGEMLTVREGEPARAVVYLGVVANLFGTGVRDSLWAVAHHKLVDHVVVSGGGVEHDLRRLFPYHDYRVGVADLQRRVSFGDVSYVAGPCPTPGRLCCFEHTLAALVEDMIERPASHKQVELDHCPSGMKTRPIPYVGRVCYSPANFWKEVCLRLHAQDSSFAAPAFAVQCALQGIPVFSPGFVDGDVGGLLLPFEKLTIDLVDDLNVLNRSALKAHRTGVVIVGGGVVKHHLCNANIMRNGTDLAVFVNTAQEYDGSDGGARPDEAVSWGKIKMDAKHVKVYAEASFVLPLLIHQAFGPFFAPARA